MSYYLPLASLDELVGEEGVLRLPSYIFEEFVFDDDRREGLKEAVDELIRGGRVLIAGRAGTGKTALMAMVLREILKMGLSVGGIVDDASAIGKEHEKMGVVLFYDDIPRMGKTALSSIVKNDVRSLIATAREEEMDELESKLGMPPEKVFKIVEIGELSHDDIKEMLVRFARQEGIHLEPGVEDIVAEKAKGLPIYVWQLVRDLKASRKSVLDREFAERIPEGMLEYVDEILWRVLRGRKTKTEALLTLRIMADAPRYEIHQDLFNFLYVVIRSKLSGREISVKAALLDGTLDRISRYLVKTRNYGFRLPHDCWADVLRGGSKGLIAPEISKLNAVFPYEKRMQLLEEAAKKCEREVISRLTDEERKKAFYLNLQRLGLFYGNVKVNAPKLIVLALTGKRAENLQTDVERTAWNVARLLSEYVSTGKSKLINEATEALSSLRKALSPGDVGTFVGIVSALSRKYPASAYNLKRAIWYYGAKQVTSMLGALLMNSVPEHVSDIISAVWNVSPSFFSEFVDSFGEEIRYAFGRMGILEAVKELSDICDESEEAFNAVLKKVGDIFSEKLQGVKDEEGVLLLSRIKARRASCRKTLVEMLRPALILSPQVVSRISLPDLLRILRNAEEIDRDLAVGMLGDDVIPVVCNLVKKASVSDLRTLMSGARRYESVAVILSRCSKDVVKSLSKRKVDSLIRLITGYHDVLKRAGIGRRLAEAAARKTISSGLYKFLAFVDGIKDEELQGHAVLAVWNDLLLALRKEILVNTREVIERLPATREIARALGVVAGNIARERGARSAARLLAELAGRRRGILDATLRSFVSTAPPARAAEALISLYQKMRGRLSRDIIYAVPTGGLDQELRDALSVMKYALTPNPTNELLSDAVDAVRRNPSLIVLLHEPLSLGQLLANLSDESALLRAIMSAWLANKELLLGLPEESLNAVRSKLSSLSEGPEIQAMLLTARSPKEISFIRKLIGDPKKNRKIDILLRIAEGMSL